jgi:hypothetical protein
MAQVQGHHPTSKPNYDLATKFAPYKIEGMLYSTSVNPQWIEGTENFWYEWKTSDGSMSDYRFWLRAEYFVEHLIGSTEWNADILQLNVEKPMGR